MSHDTFNMDQADGPKVRVLFEPCISKLFSLSALLFMKAAP